MAQRSRSPDSHGGSSEHGNPGASDAIAVSFSAGSTDPARDAQPVSTVRHLAFVALVVANAIADLGFVVHRWPPPVSRVCHRLAPHWVLRGRI